MENILYSTYLRNLLGKISIDEAKEEITSLLVHRFLKDKFDELLKDISKSSPAELSEVFKDMNGWVDEDFVERKHNDLEALIYVPSWFNIQIEFIDYFNKFLIERWHHNHEHLLSVLSSIKSNSSPEFIDVAINLEFKYMQLDELTYEGYIRKCMWTLADINSPESIKILHKYSTDPSEIKRKYADEQIRWLEGDKTMRYMP